MINNIIFNYYILSYYLTLGLASICILIFLYTFFISKNLENKILLIGSLILFLHIAILNPLSKIIVSNYVCKDILSLKPNECSFGVVQKEDRGFHVIYLYGNFKSFPNVYEIDRKKFSHSVNSQDQYLILIMESPEFSSSTALDTLKKDKELILKQRDEYFKSKMTKRGL